MSKEEAIKAVDLAVKDCIERGILAEFLTKHRAEVIDVCLTEFDEKKYADTLIGQGIEQGIKQTIEKMLTSGKSPEMIHDFCDIPLDVILKVQSELIPKAE